MLFHFRYPVYTNNIIVKTYLGSWESFFCVVQWKRWCLLVNLHSTTVIIVWKTSDNASARDEGFPVSATVLLHRVWNSNAYCSGNICRIYQNRHAQYTFPSKYILWEFIINGRPRFGIRSRYSYVYTYMEQGTVVKILKRQGNAERNVRKTVEKKLFIFPET